MTASHEPTKAQRKRLRELNALAHERALAAELAKLEVEFGRWRAHEIDAFELSEAIHRFHQGPARELFVSYNDRNVEMSVASAVQRGVLAEAELGAEILSLLRPRISLLGSDESA